MNLQRSGRPVEVLLVEDNPGDVRLTVETFWLSIVSLPPSEGTHGF